MSGEQQGAYQGIRVLELGQGVAAPYCGMLLAQHGASVTKIEPIGEGDWSRALGRRYGEFSANALVANRGKRSLALDMKCADGQAIVQRLAGEADIIIENYRPGVIDRLKLDYDSVAKRNPKVVYASLTGFGHVGPRRDLPATDTIMQGYSGFMSVNKDGEGIPRRLDMLAIDTATGLYLFQAVAAALYKRAMTGEGTRIATSLLHCALALQEAKMVEFALSGVSNEPAGAPVCTLKTADGFLSLNARRDPHFASLCQVLGKDWMADPRFGTAEARVTNSRLLESYIRPIFLEKTSKQWSELLSLADVLHAPVNGYGDIFAEPQVEAIGVLSWDEMQTVGKYPSIARPGQVDHRSSMQARVPAVGEDTVNILADLGYSAEEIERLRTAGAVR